MIESPSMSTPANRNNFNDYLETSVQKLLAICETLGVDCIVDLTVQVMPRYPQEVGTIIWHLLTNAVAHRSVNTGIIRVQLIHENQPFNTLIIEDDFGGLDRGMVAAQVGYRPTDIRLIDIIQEPGFTTRLNTGDGISGRGHGLGQVCDDCLKIGAQPPVLTLLPGGFRVTIGGI